MGFKDWFSKGKKMAAEHQDTVHDGIDRAANGIDDKTGGKYTDQIDQGSEKAKEFVEGPDDDQ